MKKHQILTISLILFSFYIKAQNEIDAFRYSSQSMFGTAKSFYNLKNLVYGIDTHMDPKEHSRLSNLLLIPFQSYRQPVKSNKGQAK